MKNYIFLVLFLLVFVSCNQTTNSENKLKIEQEEYFDSLDYSDIQFDSINAHFADSALTFFNQNEIKNDSMFVFGLTTVDFFVQKDRFPSFFTFYHRVNGTKDSCLYIAKKIDGKYEIVNNLLYDEIKSVSRIYLEDVNFDKQKDIVIKSHCMSVGRIISFYHLVPQIDFRNTITLYSTDTLLIDAKNKQVITFIDDGTFGVNQKRLYKWQNDTLQLSRYWQRQIIFNEDSKGEYEGEYLLEEFFIKNADTLKVEGKEIEYWTDPSFGEDE